MLLDLQKRLFAYYDTWMSVDPIQGCPYSCAYCVLRYSGTTGTVPVQLLPPKECVNRLLVEKFYVPGFTPLAVGNETDMLHSKNVDYLVSLLSEMQCAKITNPIILITKAPLSDKVMRRIRSVDQLKVVFFLSYSGLGPRFEPGFSDEQLRRNFVLVRSHGFPLIHYWRPLLPENTTDEAIREMLLFASANADASVFIGLKLHPELSRVITADGIVTLPERLQHEKGEWLQPEMVSKIYREARKVCPDFPLYRHASCALASVLRRPDHTATLYRKDVCPPSHCPSNQRSICESARRIPQDREIYRAIEKLGRKLSFERCSNRIHIEGEVSQEEFSFLLHNLNCPLEVSGVKMQNLYYGDIYKGQRTIDF